MYLLPLLDCTGKRPVWWIHNCGKYVVSGLVGILCRSGSSVVIQDFCSAFVFVLLVVAVDCGGYFLTVGRSRPGQVVKWLRYIAWIHVCVLGPKQAA